MKPVLRRVFVILSLFSVGFVTQIQGQAQYDLRFVHQLTNCLTEEIFIDIEVKASTPASGFGIGLQNYRFNFNLTTVPAIDPPIGPPNTNPTNRSVYISQELAISGTMLPTWNYEPHTLTGSSGNLVSYNVNSAFGVPGYPITFGTWVPVGRLRMNLADPMPPCLNLVWNGANTLILTGAFMQATAGTLSNLTVCGICQILPIELARFDVKEFGCEAVLEWETLTETNSSHFIIERSQDGETFEEVGQVEGSGNSSSLNQYRFTDPMIYPENYYRLRQVDFNGESSLSEIRIIQSSCNNADGSDGVISVYPNPVSSGGKIKVRINAPNDDIVQLEISDTKGLVWSLREISMKKGQNIIQIETDGLVNGIYFIRFKSPVWFSDSSKLVISR